LEWDRLEEATQGHEEVPKPLLVKLASKILLKILGISNWGVGYIFKLHFHKLKMMKKLVIPSSNTSYPM
jgi:hypothetical protein